MKKILFVITLLLAVTLAAGALAEDYSGMSDEELLAMYEKVVAELAERNLVRMREVLTTLPCGDGDPVPLMESYSAQVWPLTAESYHDLVSDPEKWAGRAYVVKGTVEEILRENPQKVKIITGEDSGTLPVIVEIAAYYRPGLEPGTYVKIYADAISAEDGAPVLAAHYIFLETEEDGDEQ